MSMSEEILISVDGVSKKFCRSFKRSLWYGMQDIAAELNPFPTKQLHGDASAASPLRRDEFWAVKDVSFKLRRGECLGLLGRNGAGKTTLLKLLNGLIKPDSGQIRMRGQVGALIALGAGFNPILTGRENIYVNGAVLGFTKGEIDEKLDDIIDFSEIREFIDSPVQTYSSGMQVRLGFACAKSMTPDILLIDEVLAVGDVAFRMKCYKHILRLKENGAAMIVVSHNMVDIDRVCDRVAVLSQGCVIFEGDKSTGAREYEKQLLESQIDVQPNATSQFGPRLGKIRTLDLTGQEQNRFSTGDSILVEVEITAPKPCKDLRLVIHIVSSLTGMLGSFASPFDDQWFHVDTPATTVLFTLDDIPLLKGVYQIYIGLFGKGIEDFCDHLIPAATFIITAPETDPFGFGPYHSVFFKHKWDAS